MRVNGVNLVEVDPWEWHVCHSELLGAEHRRVTVQVVNAMDYHGKNPDHTGPARKHPEHHGATFDTVAEAAAYLVEHGLIRPEQPGDRDRSGPHIKTMKNRHDEQGYQDYLSYAQQVKAALNRWE